MTNKKQVKRIRQTAKLSSLILLILILPLYLGGYPLPSFNLSFFENLWLIIMPMFLAGFIIGWKWEKLAGLVITIPIVIGLIISIIINKQPSILMILPLIPGILYLIYYYKNKKLNERPQRKLK
jgi:hypothetical protein